MTDERFAKWFEEAAQAGWPDAADFLAELREAGFEIFRPDECEGVIVESCDYGHEGCRSVNHQYVPDSPPGIYCLVEVGG